MKVFFSQGIKDIRIPSDKVVFKGNSFFAFPPGREYLMEVRGLVRSEDPEDFGIVSAREFFSLVKRFLTKIEERKNELQKELSKRRKEIESEINQLQKKKSKIKKAEELVEIEKRLKELNDELEKVIDEQEKNLKIELACEKDNEMIYLKYRDSVYKFILAYKTFYEAELEEIQGIREFEKNAEEIYTFVLSPEKVKEIQFSLQFYRADEVVFESSKGILKSLIYNETSEDIPLCEIVIEKNSKLDCKFEVSSSLFKNLMYKTYTAQILSHDDRNLLILNGKNVIYYVPINISSKTLE